MLFRCVHQQLVSEPVFGSDYLDLNFAKFMYACLIWLRSVFLFFLFMFMHVELKNIRIIELELFERTRCAIRRRLRRDESHYVQSK